MYCTGEVLESIIMQTYKSKLGFKIFTKYIQNTVAKSVVNCHNKYSFHAMKEIIWPKVKQVFGESSIAELKPCWLVMY